jgi:hypothetical protein
MHDSDQPADHGGKSEKELALWMLDKMRDSEEFLGVLKAARNAGKTDILDTPDYVAKHKGRLKKLYQGDVDDDVDVPSSLAGEVDAIASRDLLSSREEFVEKALRAYIDQHPSGADGLPADWQTTFDAARAEIEGHTSGAFEPGFVGRLAEAARQELEREASQSLGLSVDRGSRES